MHRSKAHAFFSFRIILISCLLLFGLKASLSAQSNFVSLGSSVSNQQGNISFTLGQPSYVNVKSSSGSMEFGVQQPYQFVAVTSISNQPDLLSLSIYPNPAQEFLEIKNLQQLISRGKLKIQIISRSGQTVLLEDIKTFQERFDVSRYKSGAYYINVLQQEKLLRTFKFIKL